MLCNDAYAVLASSVTHGAVWSAMHPTRASLKAARCVQRESAFHAEDQLPPDDQAQQQTFSLANMVPQTAELSRGIWEGV